MKNNVIETEMKNLSEMTRNELKQYVKEHPHMIKYLEDQDEELCHIALDANPNILCLIRNQTEELCLRAIKQDPYAICYVRKPTKKIVECALASNKDTLYYLDAEFYEEYRGPAVVTSPSGYSCAILE